MATAALILYLIGVVLAFGLRTLLAWRRTGDTGFRRPDTTAFTPTWWGTVLFAVSLLLGAAAPALALLEVPPAPLALPTPVGWAGTLTMAAGLMLALVSQHAMGTSWRIGVDATERTTLITTGVFALARNPVFTGMGVFLAGMVAAVPTAISMLAFAVFTAAVQIQVRKIEEPYLLSTHPAYVHYAARTGRFVPGLGRLSSSALRGGNS